MSATSYKVQEDKATGYSYISRDNKIIARCNSYLDAMVIVGEIHSAAAKDARIAELEAGLNHLVEEAGNVLYYRTPTDDALNGLQDANNEARALLKGEQP